MRVAVLQLAATTDAVVNRAAVDGTLGGLGPSDDLDLVVMPEATMVDFGPVDLDLRPLAEPLDGPFVEALSLQAKRLGATVVGGMFERTDGLPFNTLVALGPDGDLVATYRKIHLYDSFGYKESERLVGGDLAPVVLPVADRRVGLMTCYDLRFPEMARSLVDAGADLLALPAAWVTGERKVDHWRTLVLARAIENTVDVVAAAQGGSRYSGHSMVVTAAGDVLAEAGSDDVVLTAALSADDLAATRATNPSLANRRLGVEA